MDERSRHEMPNSLQSPSTMNETPVELGGARIRST